jgi:hypothetical protein
MSSVGMKAQCVAPRSKTHTGERCPHPARPGSEWCGLHAKAGARFVAAAAAPGVASSAATISLAPEVLSPDNAATCIYRAWSRWLARRAGPLLRYREESNNPYDFYSSDPVAEIPLRYFVSYVDSDRKGYIMDSRSVASLFAHAASSGSTGGVLNPFNRAPFPETFLRRLNRHGKTATQETLQAVALTPEQAFNLEVTDTFRHFEDLGYYTDPGWFLSLNRLDLQRLYMELADIWYHRAMLSHADRMRIVPGGAGLPIPVRTVMIMTHKALRYTVLRSFAALAASAPARSDRQTGVMYVLGSLALVSPGAGFAYPWLTEMFAPGVTRLYTNPETGEQVIRVSHAAVMGY